MQNIPHSIPTVVNCRQIPLQSQLSLSNRLAHYPACKIANLLLNLLHTLHILSQLPMITTKFNSMVIIQMLTWLKRSNLSITVRYWRVFDDSNYLCLHLHSSSGIILGLGDSFGVFIHNKQCTLCPEMFTTLVPFVMAINTCWFTISVFAILITLFISWLIILLPVYFPLARAFTISQPPTHGHFHVWFLTAVQPTWIQS